MRLYKNKGIRRLDFGSYGHIGVIKVRFSSIHGFKLGTKGWNLFMNGGRKLPLPSIGIMVHNWNTGVGWSGSLKDQRHRCYLQFGFFSFDFVTPKLVKQAIEYLEMKKMERIENEMEDYYG